MSFVLLWSLFQHNWNLACGQMVNSDDGSTPSPPYKAFKLTSTHVPRGIKTRDPSTRAVKAVLYRPYPKINLEQTRDESRKGELSQFPRSTKPIVFICIIHEKNSYSGQLQLCTPRFLA
jgi:hypothetical protein